jgi:hypothetical protein
MLGFASDSGQLAKEITFRCEGFDSKVDFHGTEERSVNLSQPVAELPIRLDHRLRAYCLAASAAGVSLLALAEPPAQAEVIYTPVRQDVLMVWSSVDLNDDGIPDVSFVFGSTDYHILDRETWARPAQSQGGIVGYAGPIHPYASALAKKALIGPKAAFLEGTVFMERTLVDHYGKGYTSYVGPWQKATNKFLGVKFTIDGEIHYGWLRMTVNAGYRLRVGITGYAYETIPNRPILAGQVSGKAEESEDLGPSSLGVLALGAAGSAH